MARRSRQRSFLHEMFLSNWNNKGTALMLAVTIWGIALATTLDEAHQEIAVELFCRDLDEVVTSAIKDDQSPFENTVILTLRGRFQDLADVDIPRVRINVENDELVTLTDKSLYDSLPAGVEVTEAKPAHIRVQTERRVPIDVRIQVAVEGTLKNERYTHDPNRDVVNPTSVKVRMPPSYRDDVAVRVSYNLRDVEPNRPVVVGLNDSNIVLKRKGVPSSHVVLDSEAPREVTIAPGLVSVTTTRKLMVKVRFAVEPGSAYLIKSETELEIEFRGIEEQLDELAKRIELDTFFLVCLVRGYQDDGYVDKMQTDHYTYYGGLPEGVEVVGWTKTQFDLTVGNPTED